MYIELRHHEDAQDAVGSALLQVCLHIRDLRDPERFRPWICSIVRNEARRLLRSRAPETTESQMDDRADPIPALPSSLLRIDIERALYRLPWDEARAVALFYLKGESIRQIAQYLGRPEGTIKRWLHLGRQRLARELDAYRPPRRSAGNLPPTASVRTMPQRPLKTAIDAARQRVYAVDGRGVLTVQVHKGEKEPVFVAPRFGGRGPAMNTGSDPMDSGSDPLGSGGSEVIASLPVGENVTAVAVNPRTNQVYVSHFPTAVERFGGHLSVIDGISLQVTAVIEVGNTPRALAVNTAANRVYVACAGDNCIDIVEPDLERVVCRVQVGSVPVALALDSTCQYLYAVNWGSWTVSVINLADETVASEIPVGAFPTDVAVNAATGRIYVANSEAGTVSVIDGHSRCVIGTIRVGRRPVGLMVSSERQEIYVTHQGVGKRPGSVRILDAATHRVVRKARDGQTNGMVSG